MPENEKAMRLPAQISYVARCKDCTYVLYNYGKIGAESFGIRHAIRERHLVEVIGTDNSLQTYDKRGIIESAGKVPF